MSLGLTLYQLVARREPARVGGRAERPAGRLVWLHAPGSGQARPLLELARRIRVESGHPVLLTAPQMPALLPEGVIWQSPPGETAADARGFLQHWRPDAVLFSGGELRPAMLALASERKLPMALVEAGAPHLPSGRDGWFPGLLKATLAKVDTILAVDESAARALRKAGAGHRIIMTGRMEEPSPVLPANEAERAALARQFATRPVWLAAALPEAEEAAVIAAHRAALRLAHRLLLIVVPADPGRAVPLAARMEAGEGWRVAQRSADEEPEAETEVFITDANEMGLWYRLAPICFLGGSLFGEGCLLDPMEAAALGAALIHGPRPGAHGAAVGRVGAARAARSVASAADLAEALSELLAPDRAARLAQAAWGVTSEGVEVTDRVIVLLRHMLGEG
ncbi:MAG: 3-deoxy-D-manno-octulosonic acid transferase [Gemmobacter sp.]|jgi:3-deoxy-D-manno-octulosonic-acid transferase|nr:3-deoxy-D-manno-octulosonic acid transferase [Gemmobacter sp.]